MDTVHLVNHSADRALSFLFRLSIGQTSALLMTTVRFLLFYNDTYSLGNPQYSIVPNTADRGSGVPNDPAINYEGGFLCFYCIRYTYSLNDGSA